MNGIFSERFKELREEKGKTQQELLDEFNKKYHYNFKKSSISMYENAKRMPEIQALTDFSSYFDVSLDYLLGKSDTRNPYNEDNKDNSKDEPITDVEKAMKIILDQPGLMLKGNMLSDESKIILANSILNGIKLAEELEKHKKGDNND